MGGIGEIRIIRVIGRIRVIENYIIGYCHIYLTSFWVWSQLGQWERRKVLNFAVWFIMTVWHNS